MLEAHTRFGQAAFDVTAARAVPVVIVPVAGTVTLTEATTTAALADHLDSAVRLVPRLHDETRVLGEESGSLLTLVVLQTEDEGEVLSAMTARHTSHVSSHVKVTTTTACGRFACLKRRLDSEVSLCAHQSSYLPCLGLRL